MLRLLKADDEGLAVMVVYAADRPGRDEQGDVISAGDLWLGAASWAGRREVKLQHAKDVPAGAVVCVGSMMTGEKPYKGDGYTVPKNTWAVVLQFDLDSPAGKGLWRDLRSGRLGGLSIGGHANVAEYLQGGDQA